MKSFLAVLFICTPFFSAAAEIPEPANGVNMGSIEVWSDDWMAIDAEVDGQALCLKIRDDYNTLNITRGYWAKLEVETPVAYRFRPEETEATEKKLSCRLRVKKFTVNP